MSNDDNISVNNKIHDPLPQDYRSDFGCSSYNLCKISKSFVTNFHNGINISIFPVYEHTEQNINNNSDEMVNKDRISNSTNNFTPTIENVSNEDSEDNNNEDFDNISEENDSIIECFNFFHSKKGITIPLVIYNN